MLRHALAWAVNKGFTMPKLIPSLSVSLDPAVLGSVRSAAHVLLRPVPTMGKHSEGSLKSCSTIQVASSAMMVPCCVGA
eukprot:7181085-Pyramimonas_sp.AAC.1